MHARCRLGIERLQPSVGVDAAVCVVERLPALTLAVRRRWRQREVGQRRPEVQAGASDDDRRSPRGQNGVDGVSREPLVLADGDVVLDVADAHEPCRVLRGCGKHLEPTEECRSVGRDHLRGNAPCQDFGDCGLAARGRPEDREDALRHEAGCARAAGRRRRDRSRAGMPRRCRNDARAPRARRPWTPTGSTRFV